MKRSWVIGGLLLTIGACTTPLTTATPGASPPAAGSEAVALPIAVTAGDAVSVDDTQALQALFESDDVQQYWGNDIVSDGSGAYFTAQVLPRRLQAATGSLAPRLTARRTPPLLQRFRKRDLRPVARSLRIERPDGTTDEAVLAATVNLQGAMDLETPLGSQSVSLQIKQERSFHARRVNGKWRLAKVGRMTISPDTPDSTLAMERLTVTSNDRTLVDLQQTVSPQDVDKLPRVRPGQRLDITVTAGRTDATPLQGVTAILRAPRLANALRFLPDATSGTFNRSLQVPERPGLYTVGAELIDVSGLLDEPARIDMAAWAFTFRVGP